METVIDLSKLYHNVSVIKNSVSPKTKICAVVKADAYGHGLNLVTYLNPYVDSFAVATLQEAKDVSALTNKDILLLGGYEYFQQNFSGNSKIANNVIITIDELSQLKYAVQTNQKRVSLKINTGMNRLGLEPNQLSKAFEFIDTNNLTVHSVFTHLFNPPTSAAKQLKIYKNCIAPYYKSHKFIRHVCASNALSLKKNYHLDMIRVGLGLYGYGNQTLKPIMRVRAPIVAIRDCKAGDYIGYGNTKIKRNCTVATVRAGYADGLRRANNNIYMRVNGFKCPLLGQICMDMCMLDISNVPARVGDYAYILEDNQDMTMLTKAYKTIPYEVLTSYGKRARRIYVQGNCSQYSP